jgi:hypothetical protein
MKNPKAFPGTEAHWYDEGKTGETYHPGMTLRDYFAGQVLVGMLVDSKTLAAIKEVAEEDNKNPSETIASNCYELADAMLKERNKS